MDAERALISRIAYSGDGLDRIAGEGIGPEHFADRQAQEIWRFLNEHTRKYGGQPSLAVLRGQFPGYDFPMVSDGLDYIYDRFKAEVDRRESARIIEDLAEAVNDPARKQTMAELMLEQARRLAQATPAQTRIARLSDIRKRIEEYDRLATGKVDPWGIRMGIPTFDDLTMGIQPHEYVTISGWLGTGKSTLTQWLMLNAYKEGKSCLYVSMEMESNALLRKWDSMITNVNYQDMKRGTLTGEERQKWEKAADRVSQGANDILIIDDVRNYNVDRVYQDAVKYRPDMVAIDYISLMSTSRSTAGLKNWEQIMHISNNLKQIARALKVPIVAVAQTNRDSVDAGPQLEHIAHSIAINQDSDIVISLYANQEMKDNKRMQVRMLKNRDGRTKNVDLEWDMEHMFFRELPATLPFTQQAQGR